jgi:hypothetical protein
MSDYYCVGALVSITFSVVLHLWGREGGVEVGAERNGAERWKGKEYGCGRYNRKQTYIRG